MESFPVAQIGQPKASEFVFARLRYDCGDWDHNLKVAANVLNSLVEDTTIPVYGCEWDYDWRNKRFQREDNTKFAVNIVVYAMTS
jgi:hypothetical protein